MPEMLMLNVLIEEIRNLRDEVSSLRQDLNGRLRALETWRARMEGITLAYRWVPMIVAGISSGGAAAALTYLLVGH